MKEDNQPLYPAPCSGLELLKEAAPLLDKAMKIQGLGEAVITGDERQRLELRFGHCRISLLFLEQDPHLRVLTDDRGLLREESVVQLQHPMRLSDWPEHHARTRVKEITSEVHPVGQTFVTPLNDQ